MIIRGILVGLLTIIIKPDGNNHDDKYLVSAYFNICKIYFVNTCIISDDGLYCKQSDGERQKTFQNYQMI